MKQHFGKWLDARGGVGIRILFASITLLCIGAGIGYFLYDYQQQIKEQYRKAGRISEYGLQAALEQISAHPSWNSGFEKTEYDGGWYTVSLRRSVRNDSMQLTVIAEGHIGNATDRRECVLTLSIQGTDSVWVQQSIH